MPCWLAFLGAAACSTTNTSGSPDAAEDATDSSALDGEVASDVDAESATDAAKDATRTEDSTVIDAWSDVSEGGSPGDAKEDVDGAQVADAGMADGSLDAPVDSAQEAADSGLDSSSTLDAGSICSFTPCAAGYKLGPDGICVSATDPYWGCGNPTVRQCAFAHGVAACINGQCALGSCRSDFADCNHNAADGCETYLLSAGNCGQCGTQCGLGQICTSQGCQAACPSNETSCSTWCADLSSSRSNCGSCVGGNIVDPAFGMATCNGGTPSVLCDGAYTNCGATLGCRDTANDPLACGSSCADCTAIAPTDAISSCEAGTCGWTCPPGWSLCGTACVPAGFDSANCGHCGAVCPAGTVCQYGACATESSLDLVDGDNPDDIIVDGTNVIYSNLGDNSVRIIGTNGTSAATLATNWAPYRLAGDGTYVYWTTASSASVVRTAESGASPPSVIATGTVPLGIVVDAANVYWTDRGTVQTTPKTGGSPSQIATNPDVGWNLTELALSPDGLFVADGDNNVGYMYDIQLGTLKITQLYDNYSLAGIRQLSSTASCLYVAGGSTYEFGAGRVWAPGSPGSTPGPGLPVGVAAGQCAGYVFDVSPQVWMIQHPPGSGFIREYPLATLSKSPGRAAAAQGHLFWTYPGIKSPTSHDGSVYRMAVPQ